MEDLIYSEESYKLIGLLFKVHNELGYGLREKDYQRAVAGILKENNIPFKQQVKVDLHLGSNKIRRYYLDFVIEDKIVLEIKAKERFYKDNIAQVFSYLKSKGLKLGIIANFTKRGVLFKRIVNLR